MNTCACKTHEINGIWWRRGKQNANNYGYSGKDIPLTPTESSENMAIMCLGWGRYGNAPGGE